MPTTATNSLVATKNATNNGYVTKLPPKHCIFITDCADTYFGLRLKCPANIGRGRNYWGNLSKSAPGGAAGILALKQPAIAEIAFRGGDFVALPGGGPGPSWTGGTPAYLFHRPLHSIPSAIVFLQKFFKVCACSDAIAALQELGVDLRSLSICDLSSLSEPLRLED